MTFNPVAWLLWLLAAMLPALLTRNPLYLTLALLATWVTHLAVGRRSPAAQSWDSFVRFGAMLWLLTIPFTMLTVHYGTLVLFNLPLYWPVIGGPITGEALLYGLSSGLALVTLLLAFATFNTAVDQARLLRLTPGFLYQSGVIAAIAVAFVPQMVGSWQTIREAQEVRGHKVRGLRDLLPLIMPLLITALERAMLLAESMESRGFGRELLPVSPTRRLWQQLAVLAGLGLLGVGFAGAGFWPDRQLLAGLLLVAGASLLAASFWDQGRRVQRSHYRRWYWTRIDRAIWAIGALTVLGWLAVWLSHGSDWLLYYPYPPYSPWPTFQPLIGLLALAPALAGLLLPAQERRPNSIPAAGQALVQSGHSMERSWETTMRRVAGLPDARWAARPRPQEVLLRPSIRDESPPLAGVAQHVSDVSSEPDPRPQPVPQSNFFRHLRRLGVTVLIALVWRR